MSGERSVEFTGEAMARVVAGVCAAQDEIDGPVIVVGGLAVLSRVSRPHRATVDLDLVDREARSAPQLEVLRGVPGSEAVEPAPSCCRRHADLCA